MNFDRFLTVVLIPWVEQKHNIAHQLGTAVYVYCYYYKHLHMVKYFK